MMTRKLIVFNQTLHKKIPSLLSKSKETRSVSTAHRRWAVQCPTGFSRRKSVAIFAKQSVGRNPYLCVVLLGA